MRIAHVVGLSPDGRSLVVATESGDELAVAADDRLRDALRGIGARHGRLETPMDSSLSPRDIQARVRAGASLDEVTEAAGIPLERVERFAAPVLAEREHIAAMAVSSSVRRRGETSGHRNLRATAAERLLKHGVDVDSLVWDSHRLADGRWAVTADYALGEENQRATFFFDPRGRYSVAADDPARWLVGEQPPGTATAGPGGGDARAADEPTVDLSDELALVRAIQEPAAARPTTEVLAEVEHEQTERTVVRALRSVPAPPAAPVDPAPAANRADEREGPSDEQSRLDPAGLEQSGGEQSGGERSGGEQPSELNVLYAMLDDGGRDGEHPGEPRPHAGPSDAAAVPDTSTGGWEPPRDVDYPVEPSPEEAEPAPVEPDRAADPLGGGDHEADDSKAGADSGPATIGGRPDGPPAPDELPGSESGAASSSAEGAQRTAEQFELETEPAPTKPSKRKRASVPSWDEIMFGGPKPPG